MLDTLRQFDNSLIEILPATEGKSELVNSVIQISTITWDVFITTA